MQHSTAIGQSLGTGRVRELTSQVRRQRITEMTQRVVMAILGGLIIVVPMLAIVLGISPQNSLAPRALAVISTSILLFALVVAFFSHMKPENFLAARAAYAAVLVTLMSDGALSNQLLQLYQSTPLFESPDRVGRRNTVSIPFESHGTIIRVYNPSQI